MKFFIEQNCFLNIDRISSLKNPLFIDFIRNEKNYILDGILINNKTATEDINFISKNCPHLIDNKISKKKIICNKSYNILNFGNIENLDDISIDQIIGTFDSCLDFSFNQQISYLKSKNIKMFISDLFADEINFENEQNENYFITSSLNFENSNKFTTEKTDQLDSILILYSSNEHLDNLVKVIINSLDKIEKVELINLKNDENKSFTEYINSAFKKIKPVKVFSFIKNPVLNQHLYNQCISKNTTFNTYFNDNFQIGRNLFSQSTFKTYEIQSNRNESIRQTIKSVIFSNNFNSSQIALNSNTNFRVNRFCEIYSSYYDKKIPFYLKPLLYTFDSNNLCSVIIKSLNDLNEIPKLSMEINNRWGKLDILISNAAYLHNLTPLSHLSEKDWQLSLNINLKVQQLFISQVFLIHLYRLF